MSRDPRVFPEHGDTFASPHEHEPKEEYLATLTVSRVTNEWVIFNNGFGVPIGCWELWCKELEWEVVL